MDSCRHLTLLAYCLLTVNLVSCAVGPVFINPSIASVTPQTIPPPANQENYVTQTVYGFLDFTTTIGNTIMVFSPQSAAPEISKEKKNEVSNIVIETKPSTTKKEIIIKPSRTQTNENQKGSELEKVSSSSSVVVRVQSDTPNLQQIKSVPLTKINVIEDVGSSPSSKVELRPSIITKVEIVTGSSEAPHAIMSKVEVVTSSKEPVVSSIVHVKSENDEPAAAVIIGNNNIGDPEYDFLSRQPSEVVEETYKVINLKPSSKFHLKPRPSVEAKNKAASTKRAADSLHPTGLVTKLGGTVVKDGTTTVHETSVIGTYISGKYAQVLQSTSHTYNHPPPKGGKIHPSPTLRILKTAAPALHNKHHNKHHRHLEPTPAGSVNEENSLPVEVLFNSQNAIKSTRKPGGGSGGGGGGYKQRFKNRQKEADNVDDGASSSNEQDSSPQPNYKKAHKNIRAHQPTRNNAKRNTSQRPHKFGRGRKITTSTTTTPSSAHSEEAPPSFGNGKRFQSRRNKQRASSTTSSTTTNSEPSSTNTNSGFSRRGYKPRVQTSTVEQASASSSLYKFKLNRSPGRWQYKTTPKPRVTIRKQNDDDAGAGNETSLGVTVASMQQEAAASPASNNDIVTPQARSDDVDGLEGSESIASIIDDDSATENKLDTPNPLETLKVEISTPPDFKDIYYEIATIKSPYTFQVGSVRNTRYITVTSTFEKSLEKTQEPTTISASGTEPLTENILATSSNYAKDNNFLDSSIATLPPIYLASDMETPPLETLTETFSTTQTMLKTHILPVVRHGGNDTTSSTLVQTYLVTRLVTATKTLPPMEAYHFIPSKTLNEFNSHLDEAGSELHLELEFGDQNEQDDEAGLRKAFPADLDLANVGSDFDLSDVDKSRILEGHLRLKKAHAPAPKPTVSEPSLAPPALNPEQLQQLALLRLLNPGQPQVITTSKPIIKLETVYESHIIPVTQGQNTILSTISKIKGTITKTDYEFGTSTIQAALPHLPQLQPQLNPLGFAQQPQYAVTTSPVVQTTVVTQTNSKVLKLTFGAKTAHTTVYKTTVVPTVVTTYVTGSVQVQPTAAFPGYFPAPYPPFPYVG